MAKTKEQLALEARESVHRYKVELRRKRTIDFALYVIISVVVVFMVMMFSGDTFRTTLTFFGLEPWYHHKAGVFADCRDPANKDNAICQRQAASRERQWKRISKGSIPFSLSGR